MEGLSPDFFGEHMFGKVSEGIFGAKTCLEFCQFPVKAKTEKTAQEGEEKTFFHLFLRRLAKARRKKSLS